MSSVSLLGPAGNAHTNHTLDSRSPFDPQLFQLDYRIGRDKPVFINKLQQEEDKLAAGILPNADISNRLNASTVRIIQEILEALVEGR